MAEMVTQLIAALSDWVSDHAVLIVAASAAYFVVSLLLIRVLIVRIPADYFARGAEGPPATPRTLGSIGLRIARNLLGIVVVVVGLIMSLPGVAGQGFLTVLLGLSLTDFPGKRRIELRIVRQPLILRTINRIREQAGRDPLRLPAAAEGAAGPDGGGTGPDG